MRSKSAKSLALHALTGMQPTMRKNFPDSKYYVTGLADNKKWWQLW
jgi:hypothetical protein